MRAAVLDQQAADFVALLVLQVFETSKLDARTARAPSATSSSRSYRLWPPASRVVKWYSPAITGYSISFPS